MHIAVYHMCEIEMRQFTEGKSLNLIVQVSGQKWLFSVLQEVDDHQCENASWQTTSLCSVHLTEPGPLSEAQYQWKEEWLLISQC